MWYFITSLLWMLLVPLLTLLLFAMLGITWNTEGILVAVIIGSYLAAAYSYARIFLSQNKLKKPKSLSGFYAPLLICFCCGLILLFLSVDKTFFDDTYADLNPAGELFRYVNLWQTLLLLYAEDTGQNIWHYLLPVIHIAGMAAAGAGYYVTCRKRKETFPFSVKKLSAVCCICILISGTGELLYWYHDMATPQMTAENQRTYIDRQLYRFPYENGYSSVDLYPYHIDNPDNRLAVTDAPSTLTITHDMPVLDGAEAAYPVYAAFANACYADIADIQDDNSAEKPVVFSNTIEAYRSLLAGDVDIFFGAELSDAQLQMAEDAGKELVMTPIAREAFVFFVSEDNPVEGLTSEQIRNIYSGKTKNWLTLGGGFMPILAYQRPENSGSQTRMQHFMGDVPLKEPLEVEFEISMVGLIQDIAEYENRPNAIGYSFRYYATQMTRIDGIKLLALDGIAPTAENIRSDTYPMCGTLMAIAVKDNPNPHVSDFMEWMTGEQGQEIVEKTGYIAMK